MLKRNSARLSTLQAEMVRGYEVRRLPLGAYLQAADALSEMPQTLLKACFPGKTMAQALAQLQAADNGEIVELISRALKAAPFEAVHVLSLLTGVPQDALLGDPAIGLDGAAEMAEAFWRLNGIENFMQAAGRLAAYLHNPGTRTGSSG